MKVEVLSMILSKTLWYIVNININNNIANIVALILFV